MSTTDPTAETLPNPYRFTVSVKPSRWHSLRGMDRWLMEVTLTPSTELPQEFRTKEEADTFAALILAALHQAVME